jgi:2,3-dihydroxybiphenyl 1,2-dioxygenase
MAEISSLGYAVFGASDLARWEHFAVDLLGLQVSRHEPGKLLTLRMDELEQRFVLEQSDADDLLAAGWSFDTEEELEEFVQQVRAKGIAVEACNPELTFQRRVEKLYRCDDPNGYKHEFYFGPAIESPFRSALLKGAGFRTGPLGLGHLLPRAKDYKSSVDFYRNVLGLKISDYIRQEMAPGFVADATFMHTKTGRHHSLATAAIPGEKILNHVMIEVQDMDDVGLAYDRCVAAGYHMLLELGHHPNDQMFSFYVQTPSGFGLEYGWGGVVIDEKWQVISYSRMSDWGHKRNIPVVPATA